MHMYMYYNYSQSEMKYAEDSYDTCMYWGALRQIATENRYSAPGQYNYEREYPIITCINLEHNRSPTLIECGKYSTKCSVLGLQTPARERQGHH